MNELLNKDSYNCLSLFNQNTSIFDPISSFVQFYSFDRTIIKEMKQTIIAISIFAKVKISQVCLHWMHSMWLTLFVLEINIWIWNYFPFVTWVSVNILKVCRLNILFTCIYTYQDNETIHVIGRSNAYKWYFSNIKASFDPVWCLDKINGACLRGALWVH